MGVQQYIFTIKGADISWSEAKAAAEALGGQLASIGGEGAAAEQAYLLEILQANPSLFVSHATLNEKFGPWIGLIQADGAPEPGDGWSWLSGETFDPFGWYPTQPDNYLSLEGFGHFHIGSGGSIGWNDYPDAVPPSGYPQVQSFLTEFSASLATLTGTTDRDLIFASGVDNTIDGGDGDDVIDGGAGDDTITGGAGHNTIFGGDGNDTLLESADSRDTMHGGLGDDTYIGYNGAPIALESENEGTDTVLVRRYEGAFLAIAELSSNSSIEILAVEDVTSTVGWSLAGNSFAQTIKGNNGDNAFYGLGGADTLIGYLGNDSYIVSNENTVVVEGENEGTDDRLTVAMTYQLANDCHIERLFALDEGAPINLTGNIHNNMLYGNDAANDLDGSGGADTMTGGFGDDRYFVNESMDVVIESEVDGGTRDEIITAASLTLKDDQFIELLTGSFGNINLTGNKFDNIITGTTEANILSGMDGNDTIEGGAGVDLIMGGNDNDILRGGGQKDRLVGGDGIDQLFGDAGNDTLEGGFGRDIMTGGDGHDRFAFSSAGHSVAGNSDEIDKFSRSGDSRDYIMLETMDANIRTQKHDKFDFIGSSGYSKNNTGEVRVVKSDGDCLVMADVNGDRQTDFVLLVNDVNKLVEADFIL